MNALTRCDPSLTDEVFETAESRKANDELLSAKLAAIFATRTAAEWEVELVKFDIAVSKWPRSDPKQSFSLRTW